ncbi:MAG: hypothetical protein HIU88_10295 [Acidobacteria bacterium]|nr:hypothetical protein [Acidobacteriota bacterium]
MDPELLRLGLEADAAHVAALTLAGRTTEADAYVEATGYRQRLERWRETQTPGRETLP